MRQMRRRPWAGWQVRSAHLVVVVVVVVVRLGGGGGESSVITTVLELVLVLVLVVVVVVARRFTSAVYSRHDAASLRKNWMDAFWRYINDHECKSVVAATRVSSLSLAEKAEAMANTCCKLGGLLHMLCCTCCICCVTAYAVRRHVIKRACPLLTRCIAAAHRGWRRYCRPRGLGRCPSSSYMLRGPAAAPAAERRAR